MRHEKSMSERLPEFLFSSIHQALGAASMCWIPQPGEQVFDSTRAADIGLELCRDVADWHEKDIATLTTRAEQAEANLLRKLPHCGGSQHETYGMGCGQLVEQIHHIYRCFQCDVPFHKKCLIQHCKINEAGGGESVHLLARAEQAEARVAALEAALTEQGLLQKTASGSMVWHAHDCPASFDFGECNYRCRVAREAFALAGTEPYVSAETRRDTEAYE